MNQFTSIKDISNLDDLLSLSKKIKENPFDYQSFGKNKTLGLLFFNPSLRTRLSTQKAAINLGMNVMVMNLNTDGWSIELEDGTIMNKGTQEHIKEAAGVISQYCDIIGIRTFASLSDKKGTISKKVSIGNHVFIGAHSTILKGVTIGKNSIIGACSLVAKNIPANEIWAGNPAKFIKKTV